MSHLPIPLGVIYAGLAGTLLALLVAAATNRWSPRVFFLLALRLAIGWHFMFEGFHKIHSHTVGQSETNRPFSSEPYFKVAPGPLGEEMRKAFSDPAAEIATKVKAPKDISPADFAKLSGDAQAAECPEAVAKQLDAVEQLARESVKAEAAKELKSANDSEAKAIKDAGDAEAKAVKEAKTDAAKAAAKAKADAVREKAKTDADKARAAAQKKADSFEAVGKELVTAAKAAYARWVYGVDTRPAQVKSISGDVVLSAPQRLEHLEWVRREARAAEERQSDGLGIGSGTDSKRVAEYRTAAIAAAADLARDANAFVAELKKDLNGGKAVEETPERSLGQRLDKVTMWFLVVVGACVMFGLFTRVACLFAAGFLVMTYLSHPAFPWYPLPPNTEGNPVFVNKNIIEALALLALACYPTGRWLGLDAIVLRPFVKYNPPRHEA
ncbi:DoxX family protein [Gemmata sp. JC673]|uniref:DoxX family protein n=1 Tax=Gemmata algarum TaxID=2975278 RepID=A0ABU5ERT6_9BACT|nr:DoxX family protein [Gemmata algarum]MDY3558048.1 DoxX family protein [Gemmata algarum]